MKKTMTGAFLCALLACCGTAAADSAKPIFKCVASNGAITFQSAPCATGAAQSEVKLRAEPKPPAPVEDAPPAESAEPPPIDPETGLPIEHAAPAVLVSYECTTSKGWVFFKHRPCPPGIREATPAKNPHDPSDRLAATQGEWLRVTGAPITRTEACRRINDLSAGAREGRVFDDITSDRDRAAGNDPCAQK